MNDTATRLVKLACAGDRSAFAELVELHKDMIFQLCYRMLRNPQEAEDIVQETFLKVYVNLDKFNSLHKFSTWIYRIATNLCIDRLRKRKANYSLDAEISAGDGADWYAMLPNNDHTPEEQVLIWEMQDQVRRAIDTLPEKYKAVIVLRYLHDLSLQEVSEVLNLPVTTVKTRVHRGREFLRKKIEYNLRLGTYGILQPF